VHALAKLCRNFHFLETIKVFFQQDDGLALGRAGIRGIFFHAADLDESIDLFHLKALA
jgi:hypothetical protein